MLVLLNNSDKGPVPAEAGPRDRLRARWHADHLDHELADGASPDSTIDRSLRAQARLLLTDAGGPLYRVSHRSGTTELRARVCGAAGALNALDPAGRPQQ